MSRFAILVAFFLALAAHPVVAQQIPEPNGTPISLAQAQRIVAAANSEAMAKGFKLSFAVVEPDGNLVAFGRMDGSPYGSIQVSQAKARSAALFRRSTKVFADLVASGPAGMAILTLPGAVASEGGVPIVVDGKMVGALGVSGASSTQDGQVAAVALSAAQ